MHDEDFGAPDGNGPVDDDFDAWLEANPEPGDLDEFLDNAELSDLRRQHPAFMGTAEEGRSHLAKMNRAEQKKARQQNRLRKRFFKWAGLTVVGSLFGNFVLFTIFMFWNKGDVADSVMIAWISATVVEVLGIAYIIANYLFDNPGSKPSTATQKRPSSNKSE